MVWLHGEHLTTDITVHFGGVAGVDVRICSQQLIKCTSPPYVPLVEHRRHEVLIQVIACIRTHIFPLLGIPQLLH